MVSKQSALLINMLDAGEMGRKKILWQGPHFLWQDKWVRISLWGGSCSAVVRVYQQWSKEVQTRDEVLGTKAHQSISAIKAIQCGLSQQKVYCGTMHTQLMMLCCIWSYIACSGYDDPCPLSKAPTMGTWMSELDLGKRGTWWRVQSVSLSSEFPQISI